ncbi:MAG: hypothetical protein PHP95_10100 [Desulfuromonadaceae bacterium]|nr:hypothetical protein [Desulfuromonadaceae bacterium]MDD2848795.1 hypothetical protein [Desulfuromonadaceae bacterium]MDD4130445.1 hypothetical protein [Desulfuromonadaceae bacterium]
MDIKKLLLLIAGISMIAYGYYLLGVAPETPPEDVLTRVKQGEVAVFLGGACAIFAMLLKS